MAAKTSSLQTHHVKDLRSLARADKRNPRMLTFRPPKQSTQFELEVLSDASMAPFNEGGGCGGYIVFRRNGDIIHPIIWSARKLRRVARSSSTAELLAASNATSAAVYLQELLGEISYRPKVCVLVDSRALMNLATSIKEPVGATNKVDLAAIREWFRPRVVGRIGWLPGYHNVADALTKENRMSAALLKKVLCEGEYPHHPDTIFRDAENAIEESEEERLLAKRGV